MATDHNFKVKKGIDVLGGDVNLGDGFAYKIDGATVVDSSRNLTNIGTISSGNITSSGTITGTQFLASGSDTTPAGTTFANAVKGVGTQRTMYFDGNGSSVSTWYGVGNNPYAAIDVTEGVLDIWVNPSNGSWHNVADFGTGGLRITYGTRVSIDSTSTAYFSADGGNNQWKYLSLKTDGSTNWDIATKNNDLNGALQFRPAGGATNRTYMDTSGNWTFGKDIQAQNATFTGTGDVTVKIVADTDNVTEADNPTLGFSQDGNTAGTLFVLGLEGNENTAFPGSKVNSPYIHANVGSASHPLSIANNGKLVAAFDSTNTNAALTVTKFSNITGTNGSTILNLKNYMGSSTTTGDLSQQKSFIDFQLLDSNANEVPQVRIGAEVGEGASADSQQLEGSGAFVVYTNDAESTSGDAGASLTEKFRVAHDGTSTFTNNVVIGGNLTVNGTQTTLNTATLQVEDKNIVLNYGTGDTSGSANEAGITIQDAVNSTTNATMLWNASSNRFDFSHKVNAAGDISGYDFYGQDHYVLNSAGNGWHEWATRSDNRVNLSVHDISANGTITISSGASSKITLTNSSDSNYNVELRTAYDYDGFFRVVDGGGVVRFAVGRDNHAYLGGAGDSGNKVFHDGYHPNADTLTTARTINGVSFNGSANITVADSTKLPLAGGTMSGTINSRDIKPQAGYHLQRSDHHSGHLEGSYNNVGGNGTKSNPIYTIGSSYNPSDAALGNMYGIGFSSSSSSFANPSGGTYNWGMYVAADGDARVWLDGSTGSIWSTNQHYVGSNVVWNAGNDGSGSGLDADLLDGNHASAFALYDHFRSLGTQAFTGTASTAGLISEMESDGAFDSYTSAFKTSWSYAGNFNMADAGRFTETAGTSFLTWTDNSSDSVRGNITVLAIAPNTGGSAGKMFVYNDQGSTYAPGWREIWTSTSDGAGSGLDADLLDGQHGSYYQNAGNLNAGTIPEARLPTQSKYLRSDADDSTTGNISFSQPKGLIFANGQQIKDNGGGGLVISSSYQINLNQSTGLTTNSNAIWHAGNDGTGSGLDADTLDGVQLDNIVYGTYKGTFSAVTMNANSVDRTGLYSSSGFTNRPSGTSWTYLDTKRLYQSDNNYHKQFSYDAYNNNMWTRTNNGGTWSSWYKMWNSFNDGAGSGLDADLLDGQHGSYYNNASNLSSGTLPSGRLSGTYNEALNFGSNSLHLKGHMYFDEHSAGRHYIHFKTAGSTNRVDWRIQTSSANNTIHSWTESLATFQTPITSTGIVSGTAFVGGLYAGATGAPDARIWAVSADYPNYGIFYNEGNPDTIDFKWNNVVKAYINMENGLFDSDTGFSVGGSTVWHAGNDGSGSGLDADLLDGLDLHTGRNNEANKVVRTDVNGYIQAGWINTTSGNNGTTAISRIYASQDGYIRYYTPANFGSQISSHINYNSLQNKPTIPTSLPANGGNADTVDNLHAASFLRSDASDTIAAGTTYTFGTSNSEGLRFTNSSYNKSLYIGGWSGTNSSGISRIRNSNDNLHLDSGSAGSLYLNHYATGTVYIRGNTAWHAGNDGTGSGLDADTVDSLHAASFLRSDATDSSSQRISFQANNTNNWDTIATSAGSQGCIEIFNNGSGTDAFMTFHVGSDFACYFGLDGGTNKLSVGGWSMGANSYEIYHSGNKPSLATLGYTGATNANYITNNNQLTNGAGYITTSGTANQSNMVTGSAFATTGSPSSVLEYQQANNQTDTKLAPSTDWHNTIRMGHGNPYSYYGSLIAVRMTGTGTGDLYTQNIGNNSANGWRKHWSDANDGSGSGLDADLLDGQHGSYYTNASNMNAGTLPEARIPTISKYLRSDTSDTMSGELNVTRNGGVTGTSAPQYSDVNIELQTSSNHVPGISFHRGGYSATTLYEYDGELHVNAWTTRSQTGKLVSFGNDGSGSGLDADTLDGQHASAFLGATAKAADSNLLDGLDSTDYRQYTWRSFTVGGDLDKFYPALFSVGNGHHASSDLEIAQSNVHQNGSGHGAFYARFGLNITGWGHVPQMMTLREYTKSGNTYISKIADTDHATGQIGIWLRGSTTYYYRCSDGAIFDSVRCTDNQPFLSYDHSNNAYDVTISHSTSVENAIFNDSAHAGKVLNTGNIGAYAVDKTNTQTIAGNKTFSGTTTLGTTNISGTTTVTGSFATQASTNLGNGNGDATWVNDVLYVGASDSGDSHFYFGENSSNWYGEHWYWDSGHTTNRYSRHAGTDTLIEKHDTRYTHKVQVNRAYERLAHDTGYQIGSYNSVAGNSFHSNPIYVIGDNYRPSASSLGSMYGIGYSHPNASFWGSDKTSDWGMYVAGNGSVDATIGAGAITAWFKNDVKISTTGALRTNRYENTDGTFMFRWGTNTGTSGIVNFSDSTSDPSTSAVSGAARGITWGQRSDNNPYYMIYPHYYANGRTSHTRLRLAWHTGVEIGAEPTYGGTRFYNNSPFTGTQIMSVGDGDNHVRVSNNLYVGSGAASAPSYSFISDTDSGMFSLGSNAVGFGTGGTQRFKINSNGLLLTGTSALYVNGQETISSGRSISNVVNYANTDGHMTLNRTGNAALIINRKGTGGSTGSSRGELLNFKVQNAKIGRIGYAAPYGGMFYMALGNTSGCGVGVYEFSTTRYFQPVTIAGANFDNAIDLGTSGARWDDVYATNGTIQTSDRNEKQDIQALTDAETRVATACKGLIRRFRWIDSVEEKGDDARYHFGAIAQDVESAFTAEGLDAGDYGLFIQSTWWEHEGHSYPSAAVAPTGAVEKTRLGIRYNQLFAFIISAL